MLNTGFQKLRFNIHHLQYLIAIFCIGLLMVITGTVNASKIKCWTNDEGVRECGNYVPQEQVRKKVDVVNEKGQVVDIEQRQKTTEELIKERELKRKQQEEARKKEMRLRQDKILLNTYASEEDIHYVRDSKVKAIDAQIKILRSGNGKLVNNLQAATLRAANFERSGKEVPQKVIDDIASIKEQMEVNKKRIHAKQKDKKHAQVKHDTDLKRYRELKKIKPR